MFLLDVHPFEVGLNRLQGLFVDGNTDLLRCFVDDPWRQVDLLSQLVDWQVVPCCSGVDKRFSNLLTVCFVAAIVLQLYMQVERTLRTVDPAAALVRTGKALFNLICASAVVSFASIMEVPF